jgi:hypothetical protein
MRQQAETISHQDGFAQVFKARVTKRKAGKQEKGVGQFLFSCLPYSFGLETSAQFLCKAPSFNAFIGFSEEGGIAERIRVCSINAVRLVLSDGF